MDEQGNNEGEQQYVPTKKEIEKQNSRDVVNTVGKEAGKLALESYGVPPGLSDLAVNKVAKNPLVKHALNKVADNPLLRKKLSKAKPLVDKAKPLLNAKGGAMGGASKAGAAAAGAKTAGAGNAGANASSPTPNKGGSSSPMGGLGEALGSSKPAGDSGTGEASAGADLASVAKGAVDTAMKIKKYWPIIAAVAPILGWILLGILGIFLIMLPIMYLSQIQEVLASGYDKFLNFVTGQGFTSSENVFFNELKNQYELYDKYNNKQGEFDSPLLAATIHYGTMIDPEGYTSSGDEEYKYDDSSPAVSPGQLRSFYAAAVDKLGSPYTLVFGEKKLMGHLVDTKLTLTCVNTPEGWNKLNPGAWTDLLGEIAASVEDIWTNLVGALTDSSKDLLSRANLLDLIRKIYSYSQQNESYIIDEVKSMGYEFKEDNAISDLIRIIKQSQLIDTCTEGQIALPVVTKFINYEYYKQYLRDPFLGYLSGRPYNTCSTCAYKIAGNNNDTEEQKRIIEKQIVEIFDQRDAYDYLKGKRRNNQRVEYIPGMSSLPLQISPGEDWKANITRGYQVGTATCFKNGKATGKTNCDHLGIDFGYATGTPVMAIADGMILEASENPGGYGLYVKIAHDINGDGTYDYYSLYAHMSKILVSEKAMIGGGQQIGEVGSTGNSTGPHLHFEIIKMPSGDRIDPAPILEGISVGTSEFDSAFTTKYYNQGNYANVAYCPGMLSDGEKATIQNAGCLPTSYAMIISKLQNNRIKDPSFVGDYICTKAPSYRIEGSGTSPEFFTDSTVQSDFRIKATAVSKADATFDTIASILRTGKPIIANVKGGLFNASGQGHYLVIDSINDDNSVKIMDPGAKDNTKVFSKSEIETELITNIGHGIWYFERGI